MKIKIPFFANRIAMEEIENLDPKLKLTYDRLVYLSKKTGYVDMPTQEFCKLYIPVLELNEPPCSYSSIAKRIHALSKLGLIRFFSRVFKKNHCIITKNNFWQEDKLLDAFEKKHGYKPRLRNNS